MSKICDNVPMKELYEQNIELKKIDVLNQKINILNNYINQYMVQLIKINLIVKKIEIYQM